MRKLLHHLRVAALLCIITAAGKTAFSGTVLKAGDIAILGFNADQTYPDQQWAFMTMVKLTSGTVIIFTDDGWDGSVTPGVFKTPSGDGFLTWTVQSDIAAGTIIYGTNNTVNGTTAGVSGTLGSGGFGFNISGDQLIVYQGTSGTGTGATFIYAFNNGQSPGSYPSLGVWQTSGTVTLDNQSYQPPGLTSTTAVALTSNLSNNSSGTGALGSANYGFDNMHYGGTLTGTPTALLTDIADPQNWIGDNFTTANLVSGAGGVYANNNFNILPITLVSFTAQLQGAETVQLKWSTGIESNNDHFTIERSTDGASFSSIGTVPGKVNSNLQTDYAFTDNTPDAGTNYYRLSQTDIDAHHVILGIRSVTVDDMPLRIAPGLAHDAVDATFTFGVWKEVRLYSSGGQLLQTVSLSNSIRRVHIQLNDYAPGTYYLSFVGNDRKRNVTKKFMKM